MKIAYNFINQLNVKLMKLGKPIFTYSALIVFNILFACNFSSATSLPFNNILSGKNFYSNDLSISYGVAKFKAGQNGVAKPTVSAKGGTFSYTRVNDGRVGGLCINTVSGFISFQASNPGKYIVTYTYNSKQVSVTVTVE